MTNLVDTGDLVGILTKEDATAVMESIYRISERKSQNVSTEITRDAVIKEMVNCGYLKAADIADRFGGVPIDPGLDPEIVDQPGQPGTGIFTQAEWNAGGADEREFRKTASIMKLVINGYAGAGCIEMGGYDYHGGRRAEGEVKDERAGRCMGACLEYAARRGVPLMMYVFSDGSLSSNGAIDNTLEGRGKGEWVSDNSSTAGSFFLVYNPGSRPQIIGATPEEQAVHQQIGYMSADGSVQRACNAGREQREPAGEYSDAELHGTARRTRPVRQHLPGPRSGQCCDCRTASRRSNQSSMGLLASPPYLS